MADAGEQDQPLVQIERRKIYQVPCEDVKNLGVKVAGMSVLLTQLDNDFNNHGKDGLKTKFNNFVSTYEEREKQRELSHAILAERDVKNRDRFRFILATVIAIVGLLISFIELNRQTHWITFNEPQIHVRQSDGERIIAHRNTPPELSSMRGR